MAFDWIRRVLRIALCPHRAWDPIGRILGAAEPFYRYRCRACRAEEVRRAM